MDLGQLVESIKERGMLIKQPIRLRRKRSKPIAKEGSYRGSAKAREDRKEVDRRYAATVSGQWKHLVKTYRSRAKAREKAGKASAESAAFSLTLEEWQALWAEAGLVSLPSGQKVQAIQLRGKTKEACKLYRIEPTKGWTLDNVIVLYKGNVLANGREIHKKKA